MYMYWICSESGLQERLDAINRYGYELISVTYSSPRRAYTLFFKKTYRRDDTE